MRLLLSNVLSLAALLALTLPAAPAAAQTYAFPFWAEDFPADVRIVTGTHAGGIQAQGKDIGAMRHLGAGRWTDLVAGAPSDAAKRTNAHLVIYGRPFHAIADGEVIGCWRNAPENPRPGQLHPDFTSANRRIIGGGNHLWVRHDDDTVALYAHAIPGSIPAALCPHNAALTPANVGPFVANPDIDPQSYVPAGTPPTTATGGSVVRPRVRRGQLLGRVGNSGSSSAPHLHLHVEDASRATSIADPMVFERGLWTRRTNVFEGSIERWTSFSGMTVPAGDVFIWPARRLAGEFAAHGFDPAGYQALFDHLANSGFWPEWIDGYAANGRTFLNFVWRPAQGAWISFFLLDAASYQRELDNAVRQGFSPLQVDSALVGRENRFNVIFRQNLPGAWLARHNLTQAQHDALFQQSMRDGLRPVNVAVTSIDGQRFYTELYRAQDTGSYELRSQVAESQYQALYDQNAAAGRRPAYVNAYVHAGQSFYSVVFTQRPGGVRKDRHGLTSAQYQAEFDSALAAGLPTRGVSSFDGATGAHRYIAFWRR